MCRRHFVSLNTYKIWLHAGLAALNAGHIYIQGNPSDICILMVHGLQVKARRPVRRYYNKSYIDG